MSLKEKLQKIWSILKGEDPCQGLEKLLELMKKLREEEMEIRTCFQKELPENYICGEEVEGENGIVYLPTGAFIARTDFNGEGRFFIQSRNPQAFCVEIDHADVEPLIKFLNKYKDNK